MPEIITNEPVHASGWNFDRAKERAAGLRRDAKDNAVRGLENASSSLHQRAEHLPGERARRIAHTTADKLHDAAGYVRRHDAKAMMSDIESAVRRHPGQSLIGAVLLGFCVGRAFRRNGEY